MGMTPLAGIVMDTRCGDIDPYIPLYIMKTQNLTPDEVNEMLNKQSGKYGLTGYSDSRDFEAAYNRGEPKVLEAMQVYIYNIVKYIGAYIAALGGVDAIVFTAGANVVILPKLPRRIPRSEPLLSRQMRSWQLLKIRLA